jgi:hypothetical protein
MGKLGERFDWDNAPDSEGPIAAKECEEFVRRYPQYVVNPENYESLMSFLKNRKWRVNQDNLAEGLAVLANEGKITLNPSLAGFIRIKWPDTGKVIDIHESELSAYERKAGYHTESKLHRRGDGLSTAKKIVRNSLERIEPRTSLAGGALRTFPLLDKLVQPQQSANPTAWKVNPEWGKFSAEIFKKADPALSSHDELRAAHEQAADIGRAIQNFKSFHPEFVESQENTKHMKAYMENRKLEWTLSNLERAYAELYADGYIEIDREIGMPGDKNISYKPKQTKKDPNLIAKVNRMSSTEYNDFISVPENRMAVEAAYGR